MNNHPMQETLQLHMIWPLRKPVDTAALNVASEYSIRTYRPGDEADFLALMANTDFDPWDDEKLRYNTSRVLPEGWFFAVEDKSDMVVGTAMCLHNYGGNTPFTGDVGWLACDPEHQGHGLGCALTARVTARFLSAGYERIQLHTEHYLSPRSRST
ncbi:GNAT family N-acetyltransferase [Candidatus Bipolaricaulota bacterium]